jgi:hypothetical protein
MNANETTRSRAALTAEIFHLDWDKADKLSREMRRDLTDGSLALDGEKAASTVLMLRYCFDKVAELDSLKGEVNSILADCFEATNHIDEDWTKAERDDLFDRATRARSTSVGDVVTVAGQSWLCAPVGWVPLLRAIL